MEIAKKYWKYFRNHYLIIIPILSLVIILSVFIINILNNESQTLSSEKSNRKGSEEIVSPLNNEKSENRKRSPYKKNKRCF